MYVSTTYYADAQHERTWITGDATIYHARPVATYERILKNVGLHIIHRDHFDAGDTPPDDYKNDYFTAARTQ
jgi:hypothetical protein